MELRRKNIVAPNCRDELFAIFRSRRYDLFVLRPGKEAVDKIDITAVGHAFKQWTIRTSDLELVPANLRNFQPMIAAEPDHLAVKNSSNWLEPTRDRSS